MVVRDAIRTLLVVLAVFGIAEVGFRGVAPYLSANSRNLAAAPARAAVLARWEQGPTVLILGNSISGDGIAAPLLEQRLGAAGIQAAVVHHPADTTVVRDWYYALKNEFVARGASPTVVLLPVGDAHPLHRVNERTEDLLYSFVRWPDLGELAELSRATSLEDRGATVLTKASALYGFRGRLQKRMLVAAVPQYEALRMAMREAMPSRAAGEDAVSADPIWAHKLDDVADRAGSAVIVVAMPTEPLAAGFPLADLQLASALGWPVIAPGAGAAWRAEDRPDGLHLTPDARDRFTELLAATLIERWPSLVGAGAGP